MASRRIYLPSPREPSGATWLINCLLELGIRTFRYSPLGMWHREKDRWVLSAHERLLRKWLPALSDHQSFEFREDIEVQWMHEWRSARHADAQILYFVRDPRDALYSRYKREAPQLGFAEFAAFPDVHTLLDKVVNWKLFNEAWLSHPRLTVVRFEDYKVDAEATLEKVLDAMGLQYGAADIARAVQRSTYERAAEAERAYRAEHPEDNQIINRSGKPMEWQSGAVDGKVVSRIESLCGDVLRRLGYPFPAAAPQGVCLERHVRQLRFFGKVDLDPALLGGAGTADSVDVFRQTVEFAASLDPELLTRANLPAYDLVQLKSSLGEYLAGIGYHVDDAFARAVPASVPPNLEVMPLERVKRGLLRRARRLLGVGV